MIPFAWGNLCVFVSTIQYTTDTYHGNVVASASSANSLARYGFAGVFPLFTIQSKLYPSFNHVHNGSRLILLVYEKLGIDWATSLLGFIALALLPIPWVLFKYDARVRAKSQYETIKYE